MGFRFQRRVNFSGGFRLNVSGSGGSPSFRGRNGSVSTKGFSVRSGITGLSFRQSWGKNSGATVAVAALVVGVVVIAFQLLIYFVPILWQCLSWLAFTIHDLCTYFVQQLKAWRSRPAG